MNPVSFCDNEPRAATVSRIQGQPQPLSVPKSAHRMTPPDSETIRRVLQDPSTRESSIASPIPETKRYEYEIRLADVDSTEIRLMELLPGSGSKPLTCNFDTANLDNGLAYETISYCWGQPIFNAELIVKGKGSLAITTTLHKALLQFRHSDRPRLLWADVVCVNQHDIEERTVQVQLMHRIYRQCRGVLIWLGDGTEQSDLGMDVMKAMRSALDKKRKAGDSRLLYDLPAADRARYGFFNPRSREIKAMTCLVARPWFSRAWVVQELALPPTAMLVCGTKSIAWDDFALVITSWSPSLKKFSTNENPGENHVRLSICPSREEARQGDSVNPELLRLVSRARNLQATDPRDKVFAFVGLAKERGNPGILGRPDYRWSTEEVYKEFVLDNITTYHNLDVLSLAHGRFVDDLPDTALVLPSWVPDLSVEGIPYPLTRLDKFALESHATLRTKSDYLEYAASKGTEAQYELRDNGNRLCLSGYIFDTVGQDLGLPFPGHSEWSDTWRKRQAQNNAWASWEAIVGTRRNTMYENEAAYDVYWKVMRGGELRRDFGVAKNDFRTGYEFPLAPYRLISLGRVVHSRTHFKALHIVSCRILDLQNGMRRLRGKPIIEYTRGIGTNVSEYRRMGKSSSGTICFLPGATQAGDSIALLQGGKVPFVLRPHGKNWQLIGEAYVHGIMEGEAWDRDKCIQICLV